MVAQEKPVTEKKPEKDKKTQRKTVTIKLHTKPTGDKEKKKKEKHPVLSKRHWNPPEIVSIQKEAWEKPGKRVAYFSLGAYRKSGWRRGLFKFAAEIATQEGCHFPVFAGGIISKEWFQSEVKRLSKDIPRKFIPAIIEHLKRETIEALNATIPMFQKPDGSTVRWYMMASLPYDGLEGESIIHRLQEVRSDIRRYKTGGEKIEIPQNKNGERNGISEHEARSIYHGVVLSKRKRLSSKYMSARPESDIQDIEDQTSREPLPDLWVHATSATALYKPKGERDIPYITLPAIHKIEAEDKKIAENQIGLTIVEEMPDGDRLIHWWNFRDLILHERKFITGVKEGASELHKQIVELLKREGARHPGRIADELKIDRAVLNKEIQFLVEPSRLSRRTRPGLSYDPSSDRYDFNEGWIQEALRYELPKPGSEWKEDSFLFFGCMHAGYTTTDYEFVVKKFPEIILKYGIKVLVGIGDFIAGLRHNLMIKGQILNMNNTEQEEFAAEILDTLIYKVFTKRFEDGMMRFGDRIPTPEELYQLIKSSLLTFLIKKGNHDTWQEQEGNTALVVFYYTLTSLLFHHISIFLAKKNLHFPFVHELIKKEMVLVSEDKPVYSLPSGINVGLIHPYMARAQTSSLRAESALKMFTEQKCQVVGVANFHTAFCLHKWQLTIGQRVVIQTGTEAIFTHFEKTLMKTIDFGPLYLRTLSHNGRIYKTTVAAFSTPILKEAIPKDTNIRELKQKLGLLGYEA